MAYPVAAIGIATRKARGAAEILAGTRRIPQDDLVEAVGLFLVLGLESVILDWRFGGIEVGVNWVLFFVLAGLSHRPPSRHFSAADEVNRRARERVLKERISLKERNFGFGVCDVIYTKKKREYWRGAKGLQWGTAKTWESRARERERERDFEDGRRWLGKEGRNDVAIS
jgi:hypothetical protein